MINFRLFGTDVSAGPDSFILLGLLMWWGMRAGLDFVWAVGFAVTVILCVLTHEFMHVFVGRAFKISCKGIRIMFMGMGAMMEHTGKSPKHTFLVAFVGPLTSFALSLVFIFVLFNFELASTLLLIITLLAYSNMLLAIFNILPIFPLDGGRVFHSIIWAVTKNRHTGLAGAVYMGRVCIVLGLSYLFLTKAPMFTMVWLTMISMVIWKAGSMELEKSLSQGD